jgi:PAS domain S-box-containing protein/putative nucleotidyltransferase with HDIG domain
LPEQHGDPEALLRMIFGLSTNFISLPPEDVDDGINDVLKAIGMFGGVDRSCVFQFEGDGGLHSTHEWRANGAGGRIDRVSADAHPWFYERIKSCEVVYIPDVEEMPPEAGPEKVFLQSMGVRSAIAMPIVSGYTVMGFIGFESFHSSNAWSENMVSLIKIVGEIFAFALSRKRITEALEQSESKYRMLFEYASDAIFLIKKGAFVDCNPRGLEMLGCTREEIIGRSPLEFCPPVQPDGALSKERFQHGGRLALAGAPQFCEWRLNRRDGTPFEAEMSLSRVEVGKEVFIQSMTRDVTERKQAEEKLERTLANLRKAMGGTIEAIVHVVETKDPYTAGHQNRVAHLAAAIAEEMELPANTVEGIRMAGVIHDIGKISVPAEILSKPGKLAAKEFELIKDHPQTGHDVLKDVEFPWPIAEIILQHHEKLDGSGYPRGLKGDEVLLEARIITVADVIEAIASHRPYRPAQGIDTALIEIQSNKGILYDPDVADACIRLFTEKAYRLR